MDTTTPIQVTPSLANRFWAKVIRIDDADSCWPWTAALDHSGYGRIRIAGRSGAAIASRVSYTLEVGPIPHDMFVLHTCIGNRRCVRPAHLYLGTKARNAYDSVEQGRHVSQVIDHAAWQGERNGAAKLTDTTVRAIRDTPASHGVGARLAREFGVSQATVSMIRSGQRWAHVT